MIDEKNNIFLVLFDIVLMFMYTYIYTYPLIINNTMQCNNNEGIVDYEVAVRWWLTSTPWWLTSDKLLKSVRSDEKKKVAILLLSIFVCVRVICASKWAKRISLCFRNHVDSGDGVVHRQGLGLRSRQTVFAREIPFFRVMSHYNYYVQSNTLCYNNYNTSRQYGDRGHVGSINIFCFSHTPLFDYRNVLPEKPDLKLPLYVSDSIEYINQMESPRFIKTHLPYKLLPKKLKDRSTKAKVICV